MKVIIASGCDYRLICNDVRFFETPTVAVLGAQGER